MTWTWTWGMVGVVCFALWDVPTESLESKNTHGYDEIPAKLLTISACYTLYVICSLLTYICKKSRALKIFYYETFIQGDKMNADNYRPVILLTSFSKVFEKGMYIRLI
jgi:hypothetical protein